MAKGKKSSGKHYTSKGLIGPNKKLRNAVLRERSAADTYLNKFNAFLSGKNVYVTVENPNKNETNKRFIRVKANEHWGDPRAFGYMVMTSS